MSSRLKEYPWDDVYDEARANVVKVAGEQHPPLNLIAEELMRLLRTKGMIEDEEVGNVDDVGDPGEG